MMNRVENACCGLGILNVPIWRYMHFLCQSRENVYAEGKFKKTEAPMKKLLLTLLLFVGAEICLGQATPE